MSDDNNPKPPEPPKCERPETWKSLKFEVRTENPNATKPDPNDWGGGWGDWA